MALPEHPSPPHSFFIAYLCGKPAWVCPGVHYLSKFSILCQYETVCNGFQRAAKLSPRRRRAGYRCLFVIENRELGRLWYWGLLEQHSDKPKGKRTSGLWRPLRPATAYVHLRLLIPKYVLLFNKTRYGFEGPRVDIKDALRKKFDYDELLRGE